jgi:uncharacterized protein YjbJ (UPF0337 family)
MTNVNRDEVEGNARKAVGTVKESVGRVLGNDDLEVQGSAERTSGGVQAGLGKLGRKVNDVVDDAVDALKKP